MKVILSDNEVKSLVDYFIELCYEGDPIPELFKEEFDDVEECLNFLGGQDFIVDGTTYDYATYYDNDYKLTEEQKTYIFERFNAEYEKCKHYKKFINDVRNLAESYDIDKDTLSYLLKEVYK